MNKVIELLGIAELTSAASYKVVSLTVICQCRLHWLPVTSRIKHKLALIS